MSTKSQPERRWATGVLVVSGAISLAFNTRHAFYATTLPWPLALGYGAGPVILAAAQSHVVALQASRGELVGGWRKTAVFGLVIGALALSFLGIYDLLREAVPNPIPSLPFNLPAILTPIVVDLMALAALHELLRPATTAPVVVERPETTTAPAPVVEPPATTLAGTEWAPVEAAHWGGLPVVVERPEVPDARPMPAPERPPVTVPDDRPDGAPDDHVNDQTNDRPEVAPSTARTAPEKTARTKGGRPPRKTRSSRPTPEENAEAVAAYKASVAAGQALSERSLADQFGRSKGWARDRIREAGLLPVGRTERPVDRPANDHLNDQSDDDETTAKEATG